MTEKRDELKPCPFCGSEAEVGYVVMEGYWDVGCNSCRANNGWFDTSESAIAAWNRRAPQKDDSRD